MGPALIVGKGKHRKQIHLAVHLPGNSIDFASVVGLARAAERGSFDFLSLSGPAAMQMLSALAAVSGRLGLVGAVDATISQPLSVARQLATLDHLSDGRAGWSVKTSPDGHALPRAAEFLTATRALWDSWGAGAVVADVATGVYADADHIHAVAFRGEHVDVRGFATVPAGPQRYPILVQEGDSHAGREFGAEHADIVVTPHGTIETGRGRYADVKARAAAGGRNPNDVKVFASVAVGSGGTAEQVAAAMDRYVQSDAADGFLLAPHSAPHGLDEFVDAVVPLLRERGVFRTGYPGATLRENLGLSLPRSPGGGSTPG